MPSPCEEEEEGEEEEEAGVARSVRRTMPSLVATAISAVVGSAERFNFALLMC